MAKLSWLFLGAAVALGCGGPEAAPESPPPPPPREQPVESLPELQGEWTGGGAGPIGWSRTYRFEGDRYRMEGYPSLGEQGRVVLIERSGNRLRLRLTERRRCGPCEAAGPTEPADDLEASIEVAEGGASFTLDGTAYSRVVSNP